MAVVTRKWTPGTTRYTGTGSEITIVDQYNIRGCDCVNPSIAQAKTGDGLPAYAEVHPDIATCYATRREVDVVGQSDQGDLCVATITYSDDPGKFIEPDGDSILTIDMMGRTERQLWDINIPTDGIGVNYEGAEVYRPYMEIVYEHLESTIPYAAVQTCTGTLNDDDFKVGGITYGAYLLLFLGARVRPKGSNWWVTYHFLYDDAGHFVIWKPYTQKSNVATGQMERKYEDDVVSEVYKLSDFDALPISD